MGCHVCSQPPNPRLGFHCPTCARNQLYGLRFDHARILLEKDTAGAQIEESIAKNTQENADIFGGGVRVSDTAKQGKPEPEPEPSRLLIQTKRTAISQSAGRTEDILSHISTLEREIEDGKKEIARRRAALAQRRSDAESANYEVSNRRAMTLATVQSSIKATDKQWNNLHGKAVESRVFLCREAATLFGLRQRTRRRKGDLTNSFSIGGINIVDLRQMNSVNPAQITTSLSHISRMVVLVSHYLALRLPAEIVVPHRGHPLPAIFTPSASYLPRRHDSSPSLSPSHSITSHSLTPRSADANAGPRPRPLFVDRSLPKLAKEDPTSYALFIEGVSLLAWDISWLCRTQGLHLGSESWEDVCDIGRNLWQLLVAPPAFLKALSNRENPQSPSPSRQDKDGPEKGNGDINISTNGNPRNNLRRSRSLPILGHYSHGSAHSFLGSVEGVEFMKTWKLPSPVKIADKLKSTLLGEMANAEWELLGEDEWEEEAKRVNDESPERGGMVLLK